MISSIGIEENDACVTLPKENDLLKKNWERPILILIQLDSVQGGVTGHLEGSGGLWRTS